MAYDNGMTAHVWAQQNKESGKSGNGNLHFEADTLYSYRTPIGRFVTTLDGRRAVLVTSETFSVTTSGKHMPALWRAIDYGRGAFAPCFTVPHLCGGSGLGYTHFELTPKEHAANLAHLEGRYADIVAKASRARTYYQAGLLDDLEKAYDAIRDYAAAFELTAAPLSPQADAEMVESKRIARAAAASTPAAIAKREKAAKARAAKAERDEALAAATAIERLTAWRAGELARLDRYSDIKTDAQGGALLRVKGGNLETSLGATVPLEHAVRVFRFAKLCRENTNGAERDVIAWHRNGRTLRVGHFQVDHVMGDGSFRAGCHLINWPEIETAAKAAGVIDEAAADTRDVPVAA